ncbi:hypothetical protein NMY22_g5016 [Coprinellus aureogranulatus]|nr:hypothetical protein NMY22_g5016 [Coprinellus aureogranulatus]
MKFLSLSTALSTCLLAVSALPLLTAPGQVCDYKAKGPLLELKRKAAVKDFTRLYIIERKPREAFDKWIPGEYIQHNPDALSGRENAITYVEQLQATPGMIYQNITSFYGEGLGCSISGGGSPAEDLGNETNPIAFF